MDAETLKQIEKHLRTIKNILTLFVILVILADVLQGCALLLARY